MTPQRFQNCLVLLRWSQFDLAATLKCDVYLVNAWAMGKAPVPGDISDWLDRLAKAHQRARIPTAYEGKQFELRIDRNHSISQ